MTTVFDIEDFIRARAAENDRTGGLSAELLELHQPVLMTWHPVWFCGTCEGSDELQHHMASSFMSFSDDGQVTEEQHNDGPLMKAGADWPCVTILAAAKVWVDHPDHGKWIPGVRESEGVGQVYVLQGGPASDGRFHIRPNQAPYLDDPDLGPNDSTVRIYFADKQGMDGQPVYRFPPLGVYRYRAATDTIEWDGAGGRDEPITSVRIGGGPVVTT